MAKGKSEEKTVPLSIVLMTVGLIVAGTAVAIWMFMPRGQSLPQLLEAATLPTAVPDTAVDSDIILLPETPLEEPTDSESAYPDHFVSAEKVEAQTITGQPRQIVIPAIDLDAPVGGIGLAPVESNGQSYLQWQVPNEFKAGWHNTSAPLGKPGNTVLNGHNNIYGEVFRYLADLEEGDEIILYDNQGTAFNYAVSQIEILPERGQPLEVRQKNAEWIMPTEDERITLVTCWPYTDNTNRLIVVAQPVENNGESISQSNAGNIVDQ